MNIEIADYFTGLGQTVLTFEFSGNFARDMTYTIAWALFALALLVAGLVRKLRSARYAALGLLGTRRSIQKPARLPRPTSGIRGGAAFAPAWIPLGTRRHRQPSRPRYKQIPYRPL